MWYKAVAEHKKLGYWANTLEDGTALIRVETNNTFKIFFTGGTFEKPTVNAVYSFWSSDDIDDFLEELKNGKK